MTLNPGALSRVVSHALRHEPWLYEIELDDEGWAPVNQLLAALHEKGGEWVSVDRAALHRMIASSDKSRHELDGERIRALYGHSLPGRLRRSPGVPPDLLFHGTSPSAWTAIATDGLCPMRRQFVHLSVDRRIAMMVGRRKSDAPVLLAVDAAAAVSAGVRFYEGNDAVWLADRVPASFVSLTTEIERA